MRCKHCNAEWSVSDVISASLTKCPFCEAELYAKPVNELTSLHSALEEIIERDGIDALRDGRRMLAIFADLAPRQRKEKTMLSYLIQCDGHIALIEARQKDQDEQRIIRSRVAQQMIDMFLLSETVAYGACDYFWEAIGGTPFAKKQMFRRFFGGNDAEQLRFLEVRAIITIAATIIAVAASFFCIGALSMIAVVALFVWGWKVVENWFDITALSTRFSNNVVISVVVFMLLLILACFAGIVISLLGVGRWMYLKHKYSNMSALR